MEKILLQCWEDASCSSKELKSKLSLRGNPCDYQQEAHVVSLWPLSFGTNCIINVLLLIYTNFTVESVWDMEGHAVQHIGWH